MFHLENMPPGPSSTIPNKRQNPFLHCNENLCQLFNNQSLSEHVNLVLVKTSNNYGNCQQSKSRVR